MLLVIERVHSCHNNASGDKMPSVLTVSIQAVLLDKIYAQYLKAISQLPTQHVRVCYHRGLVNASYYYGLLNPVTNIIVNTI